MSLRDALGGSLVRFGAWMTGYDGANDTRSRPSSIMRGTRAVDEDRQVGAWGRDRLRLECFDLYRNNAIVRGVVDRFADNVVGTGIIPQAQTSDERWNEQAESFWAEWSKVSDYRQRVPLRVLQRQVITGRMLAGDVIHLMTDGGQLQPIEAERVATPDDQRQNPLVVEGIKLNAGGIIEGYYICQRGDGGRVDTSKSRFVQARDIVHCSAPFRADQVRGIPELSPIITSLADMKQLGELTLKKAKLDAASGKVIKTADGAAKMMKLGARNASGSAQDGRQVYEKMDDILTYYIGTGESIEGLESKTPNPTYVPYIEHLLRLCGAALSMPSEMLALDFRQGSFSSNKAAMAQTYRTFINWHAWLCEGFNQRLWNWRIAKAIKEGALPPAPTENRNGVKVSQWYRVEWSQPDYSYLDPEASIDAAIKAYNFGAGGVSAYTRLKGRDAKDTFREKCRNIVEAARAAEEANKAQPGLNLAWTDVIYAMTVGMSPQGSSYAPNGSQPAEKAPEPTQPAGNL